MFKLTEILKNGEKIEKAELGDFPSRDNAYMYVKNLLLQNGVRVTTMVKWKPLQKHWIVDIGDAMHYFVIEPLSGDIDINIQ